MRLSDIPSMPTVELRLEMLDTGPATVDAIRAELARRDMLYRVQRALTKTVEQQEDTASCDPSS